MKIPSHNKNLFSSKFALFAGFGSILTLFVLLALVGFSSFSKISRNMESIVFKHNVSSEALMNMRDTARQRSISLHRMAIMMDPFDIDEEHIRYQTLAGEFIKSREILFSTKLDPMELQAWENTRKYIIAGQQSQNKAVALILQNKLDQANQELLEVVIPAQNKVMEQLTAMFELHKIAAQSEVTQARRDYRNALSIIVFLAILTALISIIIASFVIRKIRNAEVTLVTAGAAAYSANKLKSRFLANMSHELRTPLNAIIGYSEILEEESILIGQNDFIPDIHKINSAGHHLLALINDVLDLSKIESGKLTLHLNKFDIISVMEDLVMTCMPLAKTNNNHIEIKICTRIKIIVGDELRIRQALFNLLSNACKFTNDGKIVLELSNESKRQENWIVFRVIDSGIGISQTQMNNLFQDFSQGDENIQFQYGGTGLGLSITKRICELMQGHIEVVSHPGRGSTFTIHLPVLHDDLQTDSAHNETNTH